MVNLNKFMETYLTWVLSVRVQSEQQNHWEIIDSYSMSGTQDRAARNTKWMSSKESRYELEPVRLNWNTQR